MTVGTETGPGSSPLRILAVSETWQGSNAYAYVRAFRRAGHSVSVIGDEWYFAAGWRSTLLRLVRRALTPLIVRDMTREIAARAEEARPHLLFVFKGPMVTPAAIESVQRHGGVAINVWPDTSVVDHGAQAPKALPHYDWVFTTKTFGIDDMRKRLGVSRSSFVAHAYDPETQKPMDLDTFDRSRFACDASFIGTWSPKKQRLLEALSQRLGDIDLRIWGNQWRKANASPIAALCRLRPVYGADFAKAISGSLINIAILFEGDPGAPSGDQITARTFEIPAAGGFMLHERTDEVQTYFEEGVDCAMFGDADELADKVRYYLAHDEERRRIAESGLRRSLRSGYSVDDRMATVVAKARELLAAGSNAGAGS